MAVTIRGSGQVPVQIVQTVKSDTFSTSSSSLVDITGMSVTITPTNSSNRILVMVYASISTGTGQNYSVQLQRNGTAIFVGDAAGSRFQGFVGANNPLDSAMFGYTPIVLDSPSTTSAVTYKLQARTSATFWINKTNEDSDSINRGRTASSITAMEIAYA